MLVRRLLSSSIRLVKLVKNDNAAFVRYCSAIPDDEDSPLYSKWKLKDHRLHTYSEQHVPNPTEADERGKHHYMKLYRSKDDYVKLLSETLRFSTQDAEDVLSSVSNLLERDYIELENVLRLLKDVNITAQLLKVNAFLLWTPIADLKMSLENLASLVDLPQIAILPLVCIGDDIKKYVLKVLPQDIRYLQTNRISYFSQKFNIAPEVASLWIRLNTFILRVPASRVDALTPVLLEELMFTPKEIMADPNIYRYSLRYLETHLKMIERVGIKNIRTWMLRANEARLRSLARGGPDSQLKNVQAFREMLGLEESEVYNMLDRNKQLKQVSVTHLYGTMELLKEYFDDPTAIALRQPTIFLHNIEKLRSRLDQMRDKNLSPQELDDFCSKVIQNNERFALFMKQFENDKLNRK